MGDGTTVSRPMRPGLDERRCRNCCWWVRGEMIRSVSGEPLDMNGTCRRRAPFAEPGGGWPQSRGTEYCGDWDAVIR